MLKLDWKSDKMKNALRNIVVVGLSFLFVTLLTVLIEWVTTAFQVSWATYLVSVAEITVEIITTAAGVFLGLLFFLPIIHRYLEHSKVEEQPDQEAAD